MANRIAFLALYINDLVIITNCCQIAKIKSVLLSHFSMKDLSTARSILSMEVICDRVHGTFELHQTGHMKRALKNFGMLNCKPCNSPMVAGLHLPKPAKTTTNNLKLPYHQLIRKLLLITISTRPDITHTMCYLAHFISAYSHLHYKAACQVLQYLQGTILLSIQYCHNHASFIQGQLTTPVSYIDSNWAGNIHDNKSTTSYIFLMCSGSVSWVSQKQFGVTLSSCKAEYTTLSDTIKQILFLQNLHSTLNLDTSAPMTIYMDNQSTITIATAITYSYHARTKHINVCLHHICAQVTTSIINILYCPTKDMLADPLTKPLPSPQFCKLHLLISMVQGTCE